MTTKRIANGHFMRLSSSDFWDYIEDGVKDLVKVLIDLGFVPVGSCEGHEDDSIHREIFIRLGFKKGQIDLKMKLIQLLLEAQEKGVKFHINLFLPPVFVGTKNREEFDDFSIGLSLPVKDSKIHYQKLVEHLKSKL